MSSFAVLSGVCVAQSVVFCVVTVPKYHTFGTVSKFNRKIVEKAKIDTLCEL
jgi:hypothetical protein